MQLPAKYMPCAMTIFQILHLLYTGTVSSVAYARIPGLIFGSQTCP